MVEVLRLAGSPAPETAVSTVTEPAAAAAWYATAERVPPRQVIAVYDLGGGTFDAAVLRKQDAGFELLGAPAGVERLGGVDIDEAVMAHVRTTLGSRLGELALDDPTTVRSFARLRVECVEAKEALSSDTQVTIPVDLPGLHTEVRLTRTELEAMSRALLEGSVAALARAIESAGLGADEVDRVLLVGGGSRMPLVARMISGAFGRPYFVDAHPRHAVCLGAALMAASLAGQASAALVIRRASGSDDGDGTDAGDSPATSPSGETPGSDPAAGSDGGRDASLGTPVDAASPGRAGDLAVTADSVWVAGGGDQAAYVVRHRRSLEAQRIGRSSQPTRGHLAVDDLLDGLGLPASNTTAPQADVPIR
jgi:hypothetical protein